MLFNIVTICILIFFYTIYFTKMYIQKKQGIQTSQIGKRKEKDIHLVEMLMSIATVAVVPVQFISIILGKSILPDSARFTGCLIGLLGDFIFLISVITMKNSWRAGIPENAKTELVKNGIYAYSRNPAFLGFDLMYIGVCLIFCNPFTIIFSLFSIVMLHLQVLQEEKYLFGVFGDDYIQYKKKVFRYLGQR